MHVEVVYALQERQMRVSLELPLGSTVLDAIQAGGLPQCPQRIEFGQIGVWGRPVTLETRLRDQDRVEIYRRLIADPKQLRRTRAADTRK